MNLWPHIVEGLEEVLHYSTGDDSIEKIFNDVLSGSLLLWMIFQGKKHCGFLTTRVEHAPATQRFLTIIHLYVKQGTSKEVFLEGLLQFEEIAKKPPFNCEIVRFYSPRSGWVRKLKGWRQGCVEYYRVLKGERDENL
jgi:hypothetical protein